MTEQNAKAVCDGVGETYIPPIAIAIATNREDRYYPCLPRSPNQLIYNIFAVRAFLGFDLGIFLLGPLGLSLPLTFVHFSPDLQWFGFGPYLLCYGPAFDGRVGKDKIRNKS